MNDFSWHLLQHFITKGAIMDKRIIRFKQCDSRFHPYLTSVIDRLPEEVKDDLLNNEAFQILADEDVLDKCTLCYVFEKPVKTVLYLNTKTLTEPAHCLMYMIAHEIAHYVLRARKVCSGEKEVEDLLIHWGFENEVSAVRYDKEVAQSEAYMMGYDWGKKQSQDYLMQHFGLYFDEWNEKGLGSISDEGPDMSNHKTIGESILNEMMCLKNEVFIEPEKDNVSETPSPRKMLLAGVMAAVKELKLRELNHLENCTARPSAYKYA
jgi:predicted hydrocarbon binding protein